MTRAACLLAVAIVAGGGDARANGAFPDSLRIFAPADRPAEIILATNFGLMMSTDDGATWDWVCEHGDGFLANLYQLAAAPSRRMFAVAPAGLVYTDDDACGWTLAPDLKSTQVTDAFADPVNPRRVLALAAFITPGGEAKDGLFISTDAGATFGQAKYLAPPDYKLQSVEVAASDAKRIYLTAFRSGFGVPGSIVVRSDDGGTVWTVADVTGMTGEAIVRIAAIDPVDPGKVYFRVTGAEDAIGLSTDGGSTVSLPLKVAGQLTGLLRRANGTILVSALDVVDGAFYQSMDGGQSFSRLASRLHIRALAERSGKLYAATDNVIDGFAVAVSADDGATFQPVLRFDQIAGAKKCGSVPALCAASCANLVNLGTFKSSACSTSVPPRDAGQDVAAAIPPASSPQPPKTCGCDLSPGHPESVPASLLFALGVAVGLVGRRRHPHQRALGAAGGVLALLFIAAGGLASCSNGVVGGGDGSGPGPGAGGHDSGARGGDPGGGGDPGAGGGEAGASGGAGGSAGSLADAGPPLTNTNCLEVRTCASGCTDETCIAGCIDRGAPAARVLYEDLRACSKRACPDQTDQTCRCEAECIFGPGACAEIQDMCADGATDITCEKCL